MIATSEPATTLGRRLAARLHLAICPECRAFRRQIRALSILARKSAELFEEELPGDFEATLTRDLARPDKSA